MYNAVRAVGPTSSAWRSRPPPRCKAQTVKEKSVSMPDGDQHSAGVRTAAGSNPAAAGDALQSPRRSRGTILIVDDEECVRRLVKRQMEGMGFETLVAASGGEAVQLFAQQPGDVRCILLDLTMPGMDGAETLRQLKGIRRNIPVVIISGYGEPDVLLRLQGLGVAGVLSKPYARAVLESKLAEVLGEG